VRAASRQREMADGGVRWRAAAGLTGENRSRAPGLDSARGKHLHAVRRTTKQSRAALAAGTWRRSLVRW
jgi:hypothetical protein